MANNPGGGGPGTGPNPGVFIGMNALIAQLNQRLVVTVQNFTRLNQNTRGRGGTGGNGASGATFSGLEVGSFIQRRVDWALYGIASPLGHNALREGLRTVDRTGGGFSDAVTHTATAAFASMTGLGSKTQDVIDNPVEATGQITRPLARLGAKGPVLDKIRDGLLDFFTQGEVREQQEVDALTRVRNSTKRRGQVETALGGSQSQYTVLKSIFDVIKGAADAFKGPF